MCLATQVAVELAVGKDQAPDILGDRFLYQPEMDVLGAEGLLEQCWIGVGSMEGPNDFGGVGVDFGGIGVGGEDHVLKCGNVGSPAQSGGVPDEIDEGQHGVLGAKVLQGALRAELKAVLGMMARSAASGG